MAVKIINPLNDHFLPSPELLEEKLKALGPSEFYFFEADEV